MKTFFGSLALLALAMLIAAPVLADDAKKAEVKKEGEKKPVAEKKPAGEKKPAEGKRPGAGAGLLKMLEERGIQLSDEQKKQLEEALAKQSPPSGLQKKVAELRKQAIADGKKGKEAEEAVFGALSDDEKAELKKQNAGGPRAVLEKILTEEQRAKLKPEAKKPAKGEGEAKKPAGDKKPAEKKAPEKKAAE